MRKSSRSLILLSVILMIAVFSSITSADSPHPGSAPDASMNRILAPLKPSNDTSIQGKEPAHTAKVDIQVNGSQTLKPQKLVPIQPRSFTIPIIDISGEKDRQVVVNWGTDEIYNGHPDTLLMPDGKTIWAVWTYKHGGTCGPMKKSTDGGLTWGSLLDVPDNWKSVSNCPTIHLLNAPDGTARLFVFAGTSGLYMSHSEDKGGTWSPMSSTGLRNIVAPMSIIPIDGGRKLRMWYEDGKDGITGAIWQADSADGGLTWGNAKQIINVDSVVLSEPDVIRSPDGRQLLMLIRAGSPQLNSLYATSDDEGETWSDAKELTASLTGHRHHACYAPDGRLVVVMRDVALGSPTAGSFVAWVGRYDDIIHGREGQYRVKLLQQYTTEAVWPPGSNWIKKFGNGNADCGYAGLDLLPDGTFLTTTYVKYTPGPEMNSIVSVRFRLDELDSRLKPDSSNIIPNGEKL